MNEACETNNAENVKPQIEESREDSTEVSDRMEDGNTPVGGPLVSGEGRKDDFPARARTQYWSVQMRRKSATTR